jgi:predicted transposase/invertase (TIGR01784 family)
MDDNDNPPVEPKADDQKETPPPLADPVFMAIFDSTVNSSKAMKSFVNATFADSGDRLVGDVVNVVPQRIQIGEGGRGYRVDVEATTKTGEVVMVEVQLANFARMNERSLLYGQKVLAGAPKRGDKLRKAINQLPKVIVINILDFILRRNGKNFHQVGELVYREPPHEIMSDYFEIHHLQLPRFKKISPDFRNPLHCWLTAIIRAQSCKKPLKEIVDMDNALRAYYEVDPGFAQFVDRHGLVASNPRTRRAYDFWVIEQQLALEEKTTWLDQGRAEGEAEGRAKGEAEGRAKGEAENSLKIALNAFRKATSETDSRNVAATLKAYGLPVKIIEKARAKVKAEQEGKA